MAKPHPGLLAMVATGSAPHDLFVDMGVARSAIDHKVAGLLLAEVSGEAIEGDPDALQLLATVVLRTKLKTRQSQQALCSVLDRLDGVARVGLAKGLAIGMQFYSDADIRPAADVDIFIHPDDFHRFGQLASLVGPLTSEPALLNLRVGPGRVYEHSVRVDNVYFDIHTDIINLILPVRQTDLFWSRVSLEPCPCGAGKHQIHMMDLELTVLTSVLHFARDCFLDLRALNDLRLMLDTEPDWEFISDFTETEGTRDILVFALEIICDLLGRTSPMQSSSRIGRWAIATAIWPERLRLRGWAEKKTFERSAQSRVSLLITGRKPEVLREIIRRLFPSGRLLDLLEYPAGPYPFRIIRHRVDQTRELREQRSQMSTRTARMADSTGKGAR